MTEQRREASGPDSVVVSQHVPAMGAGAASAVALTRPGWRLWLESEGWRERMAAVLSRLAGLLRRETEEERLAREQNNDLERRLAMDRSSALLVKKILLLGDTNCGKTTIFKQMRVLHMEGFSPTDRLNYRFVVQKNVVKMMSGLVGELERVLSHFPISAALAQDVHSWKAWAAAEAGNMVALEPAAAMLMERLWASAPLQAVFASRRFHISPSLDNAKYFLDDVARIGAMDYAPTNQDILNARQNSSSVSEIKFRYRRLILQMVDVGGQASERRKWIHLFDDVECVLFVAAISDYDQSGGDQDGKNRLRSSMQLLSTISSSLHFRKAAFILFLNKMDIFRDKLRQTPLSRCFASYKGSSEEDQASEYVKARFANKVPEDKDLYVHLTTATDTENVHFVFESCMDRILRENAKGAGFG